MKKEIAVGLFFFFALSILGYFTIIMSDDLFAPYEYYDISVVFPNIEGLGENDKVKVNGVLSGIVNNIELKESAVIVTLKMHKEFILYENYKIAIKNETSLGGKYVSISPGTRYHKGKRYAIINTRKHLKGESLGDVLGMLAELIDENRENVFSSLKNIKEITDKINSGQGTLGKLINEEQVHENADTLVQEIRDTIEDSREQAPVTSFIRALLIAF